MSPRFKIAFVTFGAACALALPGMAQAAEVLTVATPAADARKVTVSAFDPIGQSFTAFTDTISSIGFQFSTLNPSRVNSPLSFSLFKGETLTGTSLFTQSFTLPASITSRDVAEWVYIDLGDLMVNNGESYTAVINATSSFAALALGPGYNPSTGVFTGGDAYAGGKLLTNSSSIYANCQGASNNCDLNFSVTGDFASAVPEPSTWALLILGFGVVGAAMRRKAQRTTVSYA